MAKKLAEVIKVIETTKENINLNLDVIKDIFEKTYTTDTAHRPKFDRLEKLGADSYKRYETSVKVLHKMVMEINTEVGRLMEEIELDA